MSENPPRTELMGSSEFTNHHLGRTLEVRNLVKSFKVGSESFGKAERIKAVDDVSLFVPAGTTMGLVGESGSGKSTIARLICRLLEPDSGQVLVDGDEVTAGTKIPKGYARKVQIVFQDPTASLNPRWKVRRLVAEGIRVHGLRSRSETKERVAELVSLVGLPEHALDRYPHEFSGGQRQRIAIARALAVEPEVLVLDEPVSALDVSVQAQILVLLQELQAASGLTYLLIAHDLAVVERFCDEVAVIESGRIVEAGDPEIIHSRPEHPYTKALVEAHPVPDPHERTMYVHAQDKAEVAE